MLRKVLDQQAMVKWKMNAGPDANYTQAHFQPLIQSRLQQKPLQNVIQKTSAETATVF